MRLTALCICGILLAFSSLSWTSADSDEGDVLGDNAFRPCAATLRPEGLCRQGQDESTCPYLFSLPPLTLHLPKQLRELEKIVKDLQKLKDNVDQLRKMCADCTVSQTERECGRQRERGHEKLNEGTDRHKDERNWLNERNPKRPKDFSQECGTDRVKAKKTMEGDGDTDSEKRTILEEKGRKKWEAERESDKVIVKENQREETLKVAEKDGKTKTEGAKRKDKLGQAKVPTAGGNEKIVDMVRKKVVEKNNRETETDRNKDNNGKGNSKEDPEDTLENGKERKITSNVKNKEKTEESDHHVWQDETETEKNTQTEEDRGSDGIKMSEGHDEHTNQEREQHREERKKEMEKGIKVERNNEKPKQTESIGHVEKEKTIKEGEVEDGETGMEIKTEGEKMVQSVQRDSDGELASSKATERTDFVSISPTPQSIISLAPRQDAMDSNEAITFTSSLPSPLLSSSTLDLITDVNQGMTIVADGLPTQSTGFGTAVISEHPSPDAEEDFRATSSPATTATINTLGGPGQQITSATSRFTSTTSARPGADFQGRVSSTTATTTTTTPRQNLYTTTSPGVADRSRWTAKKNISSNSKTGVKPLPGREPKPSEKHKPAIKPEADQRLKNPRNDHKPVRAPLPDKKTKLDQKQKPSHQKPTTDPKSKPSKDPKQVQIPTPDQRTLPSHLPTDQNLKNNQIPKHDQEHTADQSQLPIQKPTSQKPQTVSPTGSDKDLQTGREPESVEIPITSQNSKLEKKLVHPLKSDKPDQPQKTKPDQRSTINQYFPPVQNPEPERSETTSLTPTPNQKPINELMEYADENPFSVNDSTPNQKPITELMEYADENPFSVNDSTPEQKLTPGRPLINTPDQKPKPSQKIPKINQKPKPNQKHPDLTTGQKTKPHVKPKPDQIAQTNQGLIIPQPDQIPDLYPKYAPDEIPEAESNKTSKPRPPPILRPPTRLTVRPGATPVQMPKPAVQQKPSPKTKADSDPLQTSGTKSEDIQNSQTDMPPALSPGTQIAEVSHSPGDTEFSPITMQTITLGPKTSNSLDTGRFLRLHTLPEGFTMSPNSRITSDLRPQTTSQPPLIPMTTSPQKNIRGILPSVIPSTSPGSTKPNQGTDSRSQAILHNVEETAPRQTPDADKMMIPVPTPSAQTTSTNSPDLRSTTPATSGPEPPAVESSTPSARELRVKINQVAAFFKNSLSPNGRPPDRRTKEHPEDNQGGSRPDSKLPTLITSKVNTASDCSNHLLRGETKSGVYLVTPDLRSKSFPVFCDMELDGGGWTLLQRRQDGSVSFNRTWAEYRSGFGELDGGEFWLGNNMIHLLTRDRDMVLRVELEDFNGVMEYAEYEQFRVASERMRYRLTVGGYSGTAGDALRFSRSYDHNNRAFTTPDRDHDRYPSGNCGAYYSSGWWFDACMAANLNGRYYVGSYKGVRDGIFWGTWQNISNEYYPTNDRQSFKTVTMMIRPKGFTP
ncbi:mucin-2-like isoform X2 [Perca fluviatilis]|uniref:mucin-2-like isoform X2 n=1 Tax=Perca fluviatilis TaxID=8168 RepID=UPI0019642412|nr:mucin-2-like isoform X2 [Perca fluviatilis]